MRVPLEVLRLILEQAAADFTLKELFGLRLVSRLINQEVLEYAFIKGRFHQVFRHQPNAWRHCPDTIQRTYLYLWTNYHHKCPSIFSALLYRTFRLQICLQQIEEDHDAQTQLLDDMLNGFDLKLLSDRYIDNPCRAFAQGRALTHWLREYDAMQFTIYPSLQDNIRLYLLLRLFRVWPNSRKCRTYRFHWSRINALLEQPPGDQCSTEALAKDILKLTLERGRFLSTVLNSNIGKNIIKLPLLEPIVICAERKEAYCVARLLYEVIGGAEVGLSESNDLLHILADWIIQCVNLNEQSVARYIIERLGYGKGLRGMHEFFSEIWGKPFRGRRWGSRANRYRLGSKQMPVLKGQVEETSQWDTVEGEKA